MDGFKPKAGSIASVAVIDETFNNYRWVFGKHEISEAFGANASDHWFSYLSQVSQFEQFRDTSFQSIENSLNEDQTRLEKQLREAVAAWIMVLQECDDMIAHCQNVESIVTSSHRSAQGRVTASLGVPFTGDSTPHSPTARGAGQDGEPHSASPTESRPTFFRRMRKIFSPGILSPRRPNVGQGIQAPENRHQATIDEAAEADSTTADIPVAQSQEFSSAARRWENKRQQFIQLLKKLERHNLSCSQRVVLTQPESVAANLLETRLVDSELLRYRSGGERLQNLVQCLKGRPQQSHMTFQLLLQSDPFDFKSKLCVDSSTCRAHFGDGSAAFYLRLSTSNSRSEAADVASLTSAMLRDTDDEQGFFVFNVSQENAEIEPSTEIVDLALLFEPRIIDSVLTDWATFYGHFEGRIRVVSDSTPHSRQRSFVECVTDPGEQRLLEKAVYASMRAQLAFVVASSLFYKFHAEGIHDVEATHIHYHTSLNGRRQEPDYLESRILPYISLDTIGSTATLPSSADALIRSTRDDLEERMMKHLGILLYEIGAWKSVAAPGLQERVTIVDDAKEYLRETMTTKYRDVINECLSYRRGNDRERWMIRNIISPLKEVYVTIRDQNLKF